MENDMENEEAGVIRHVDGLTLVIGNDKRNVAMSLGGRDTPNPEELEKIRAEVLRTLGEQLDEPPKAVAVPGNVYRPWSQHFVYSPGLDLLNDLYQSLDRLTTWTGLQEEGDAWPPTRNGHVVDVRALDRGFSITHRASSDAMLNADQEDETPEFLAGDSQRARQLILDLNNMRPTPTLILAVDKRECYAQIKKLLKELLSEQWSAWLSL